MEPPPTGSPRFRSQGLRESLLLPQAWLTRAIKSDGTVWAWGDNYQGQLGDGTTTNRNTPVQVSGLTGVTAIAAGVGHTVAIKGDGTVWAEETTGLASSATGPPPIETHRFR